MMNFYKNTEFLEKYRMGHDRALQKKERKRKEGIRIFLHTD
jgi:hypothetical protein